MKPTASRTVVALLAVAAACIAPGVAFAQAPTARVVLYEVSESLKLTTDKARSWHSFEDRDGDVARNVVSLARLANASLLGSNILAFDGASPFAAAQYMTATAVSDVSLNAGAGFGLGPISGQFNLAVFQDLSHSGQKLLSDLVIVNSGQLHGVLDLRPALDPNQPKPFAPVSGQWGLRDVRGIGGGFSGVFLIPFQLPEPVATAFGLSGVNLYLDSPEFAGTCLSGKQHDLTVLGLGSVCELDPKEQVLGFPLTKAVIFLFNGR